MSSKIEVAIIEDIKEIAFGLKEIVNSDPEMSCQRIYHNAEEAIHFLSQNPVDVVLTDIGLPGENGISAVLKIREKQHKIQFCMFTVFEDNERIFQSLQAGAKGYILKNTAPNLIIQALKDLHNGGSPINPEIARKILDSFHKPAKTEHSNLQELTKRENELLHLLSKGLLYKEISQQLGITVGTVKQHVHKIYDKLEVNNRTEAINKYLGR